MFFMCCVVFEDVSFMLYEGEILGIIGLFDLGCNELVLVLVGVELVYGGQIVLDGQ